MTSERSTISESLAQAIDQLETNPQRALTQAQEILRKDPGHPVARLVEGQALRRAGDPGVALRRMADLVRSQPGMPEAVWELAQAASEAGEHGQAIAALERLTRLQPMVARGWFLLARECRKAGRDDQAWRADLSGVRASSRDPALLNAAVAMNEARFADGEAILEARLSRSRDDPVATRLLGEINWRRGDMSAAMVLVERAVALAPGFDMARDFLIRLLLQNNRLPEALEQATVLTASPIRHPGHRLLMASVMVRLGHQEQAKAIYEDLLAQKADEPQLWQNLGHVQKTLGDQADAIHSYRQAVTYQPTMGEAWWSLANLKTVRLDDADIAAMEQALAVLERAGKPDGEDIFHIHFSLGKALEDRADYAASFRHYAQGNRLRRAMVRHDADEFAAEVAATAAVFTAGFISERDRGGCQAPDPIFIVGLPRSGSTLVEQILASHSQVEGTMELSEMMIIAGRLQSRVDEREFPDFQAMIDSLSAADCRRLGEEYIERTRAHRQTAKPLFVDKMPNNWQHVGLIRLILPNAKVIDARRHPISCCFSAWKQHFARGQAYSYDMVDIGRYYRDYMALMATFDLAAPGAVHRVIYEKMVKNTRGEITRMLAYLGLPFEEGCVTFWQNKRAVRTASSEQVRQPIFTDAVDHWHHFEEYLSPLIDTLGDAVDRYAA
ncbi:tetratricopeptide repeat-containing sulfotransferase family protein [Sphingomonas bacterium]|uniref:tetratricopeptide repeat-containing sulfotransferase family protein n=1 Tax=Sphingomonas bacterium TaxID=1895847 RepID=UPI00157587C9|nr:tetratricopeptide repeat-containing sulfotransferase family protein [Sphingomonas bacterium]